MRRDYLMAKRRKLDALRVLGVVGSEAKHT